MATVMARTARTPRLCTSCQWSPSLRDIPTIAAGHRYLRHVAFPGDEGNDGTQPWVLNECISCLGERDSTGPLLVADACGSFCHGDVPCARPFKHDGDHSCRRDAEES